MPLSRMDNGDKIQIVRQREERRKREKSQRDIGKEKERTGKEWCRGALSQNYFEFRIKIEPVMVGADSTIYVWFLCQIYVYKSHLLYVEIQIIFGTVWYRAAGQFGTVRYRAAGQFGTVWYRAAGQFGTVWYRAARQFGTSSGRERERYIEKEMEKAEEEYYA